MTTDRYNAAHAPAAPTYWPIPTEAAPMCTCTSCGKPFIEHLGIIGTCKKEIDQRERADRLEIERDNLLAIIRALQKKIESRQ